MTLLLTNTATLTVTKNGFKVSFFIKKGCDEPLTGVFTGKIISVDARYENFCIIVFNDNEGKHTLVVTDYEEPLLDGELMFIQYYYSQGHPLLGVPNFIKEEK